MPSQLALPNGQMHTVGQPVEDPAPEQAAEDAHTALEEGTAEPVEPEVTPCRTAFTVYLMADGEILFSFDAWAAPEPGRKPTFDEMYHGASVATWHIKSCSVTEVDDSAEGCLTAFTPYLTHDGRWLISADANDPLIVDREPTTDEIVGGLAVVMRDVHTQEILQPVVSQFLPQLEQRVVQGTTQNVIGNMIQLGQQAQQAKQGMDIAQQLEQDRQRRAGGR